MHLNPMHAGAGESETWAASGVVAKGHRGLADGNAVTQLTSRLATLSQVDSLPPKTPHHGSIHTSSTRSKKLSAHTTFALLGGLGLLVVAQFILFPLLFTALVHHPIETLSVPLSYQRNSLRSIPSTPGARESVPDGIINNPQRPADGNFNGAPIYLQANTPDKPLLSKVHCVGENFHEDAWQYKSCRFHNLCFDTEVAEFVLFQDPKELKLHNVLHHRPFMAFSSITQRSANSTSSLSIGGINQKWGGQMKRLEWFPRIRRMQEAPDTYYQLDDSLVMVPFHSLNGANPGHLVWDDFLPIYNLLQLFQLEEKYTLFLLRYVLTDGHRPLWASCDVRPEKMQECEHMINKFLPLMVGMDYAYKLTSSNTTEFRPAKSQGEPTSPLVCAKTSVAGIGALTDHGVKKSHGWEEADYRLTQNAGRGGTLYAFRNFMVRNMGLDRHQARPRSPHRIVFSSRSSDIPSRDIDFQQTILMLRQAFPDDSVEGYVMKDLSLKEQIQIAADTSIYITVCGGGAVNAMFLPRGASVILFFSEDGGVVENKLTYLPARLDWDLFQHMSHLRVHWMPRNTFKKGNLLDLQALIELIRHELHVMDQEFFD